MNHVIRVYKMFSGL